MKLGLIRRQLTNGSMFGHLAQERRLSRVGFLVSKPLRRANSERPSGGVDCADPRHLSRLDLFGRRVALSAGEVEAIALTAPKALRDGAIRSTVNLRIRLPTFSCQKRAAASGWKGFGTCERPARLKERTPDLDSGKTLPTDGASCVDIAANRPTGAAHAALMTKKTA
jgi:hypothetical protein